jgi:hypothetical protein
LTDLPLRIVLGILVEKRHVGMKGQFSFHAPKHFFSPFISSRTLGKANGVPFGRLFLAPQGKQSQQG